MLPIKLQLPENFLEEELRGGIAVPRARKELWAVCLDLLSEFMRVCDAHGIQYFAFHGTLLGAVRHGGFIPWDDDVDLAMTRENYRKLCEIGPKAFQAPYFFQTEYTDFGLTRFFARLRNSETTAILPYEDSRGYIHYNQGIFIDIFPLDNLPDDPRELERWTRELDGLHEQANRYSRNSVRYCPPRERAKGVKRLKQCKRRVGCELRRFWQELFQIHNPYLVEYEKLVLKYDGSETRHMGDTHFFHASGECVYPREMFVETVKLPFEFLDIPVPRDYERCLELRYGKNWRTPIQTADPEKKIIFASLPYKEYLRRARRGLA